MTIDELSFPVITFASDGSVLGCSTRNTLTQCSGAALRHGYFIGLVIVDSQGHGMRVQSAQPQRVSSIALSITNFFSGMAQADLNISPESPEDISLHDLKARINAGFAMWCDDYAADQMRQAVHEAPSYEAVINLFCDE